MKSEKCKGEFRVPSPHSRKVVVMGVGNPLRGDDGAGPMVIGEAESERCKAWEEGSGMESYESPILINAEDSPEAHLEEIRRLKPDLVVIIDAVDFGGKPGEVRFFGVGSGKCEERRLSLKSFPLAPFSFFSLSTHRIPLRLLARYIREETGAEVVLLGIQPKRIGFGNRMSEEVMRSAKRVAKLVSDPDWLLGIGSTEKEGGEGATA